MGPKASIIVLNYNGRKVLGKLLDLCIESLLNQEYDAYEVIFVDNGSIDDSVEYVKKKYGNNQRLRIIRFSRNLGPVKGFNEASKYAHGSILIISNNDVIVPPHVLPSLINYLERHHRIGIVSPSVVEFETLNELHSLIKGTTTRTKKCKLGPFYAIKRKLWIALGGFDEMYYFYGEETDLCLRAELLGFRVLVLPNIIVYHRLSSTVRTRGSGWISYNSWRSKYISLAKWCSLKKLVMSYLILFALNMIRVALRVIIGNKEGAYGLLKAHIWTIKNFKYLMKKRNQLPISWRRKMNKRINVGKDVIQILKYIRMRHN